AAAISSFARNEPRAVLDGNVYRVLSRYLGIYTPINSSAGKREFTEIANKMLDKKHPGDYNQAIMDFGALQCKPRNPDCETCVLKLNCAAYQNSRVEDLPVKLKKKASKNRYLHYFIIQKAQKTLMSRRGTNDVWAKLYEFPHIETKGDLSLPELLETADFQAWFSNPTIVQIGPCIKHILSHQNIYAKFYRIENPEALKIEKSTWNYFMSDNLDKLAKHKLIFSFLESNSL